MQSPIVSAQWLHDHQSEQEILIIDCRFSLSEPTLGFSQYQQEHIEGAYFLDLNTDLSSPVQEHGGRHPLPDIKQLSATLSQFGICSNSKTLVVIYDNSRFAFASRLWWLLHYMGHTNVAILDGGFNAWQQQGFSTS